MVFISQEVCYLACLLVGGFFWVGLPILRDICFRSLFTKLYKVVHKIKYRERVDYSHASLSTFKTSPFICYINNSLHIKLVFKQMKSEVTISSVLNENACSTNKAKKLPLHYWHIGKSMALNPLSFALFVFHWVKHQRQGKKLL